VSLGHERLNGGATGGSLASSNLESRHQTVPGVAELASICDSARRILELDALQGGVPDRMVIAARAVLALCERGILEGGPLPPGEEPFFWDL